MNILRFTTGLIRAGARNTESVARTHLFEGALALRTNNVRPGHTSVNQGALRQIPGLTGFFANRLRRQLDSVSERNPSFSEIMTPDLIQQYLEQISSSVDGPFVPDAEQSQAMAIVPYAALAGYQSPNKKISKHQWDKLDRQELNSYCFKLLNQEGQHIAVKDKDQREMRLIFNETGKAIAAMLDGRSTIFGDAAAERLKTFMEKMLPEQRQQLIEQISSFEDGSSRAPALLQIEAGELIDPANTGAEAAETCEVWSDAFLEGIEREAELIEEKIKDDLSAEEMLYFMDNGCWKEDEVSPLNEDEASPIDEDEVPPLNEDEAPPLNEDEASHLHKGVSPSINLSDYKKFFYRPDPIREQKGLAGLQQLVTQRQKFDIEEQHSAKKPQDTDAVTAAKAWITRQEVSTIPNVCLGDGDYDIDVTKEHSNLPESSALYRSPKVLKVRLINQTTGKITELEGEAAVLFMQENHSAIRQALFQREYEDEDEEVGDTDAQSSSLKTEPDFPEETEEELESDGYFNSESPMSEPQVSEDSTPLPAETKKKNS